MLKESNGKKIINKGNHGGDNRYFKTRCVGEMSNLPLPGGDDNNLGESFD